MEVKKYIVFNKAEEHDYTIVVENSDGVKTVNLFTSNAEHWNEPFRNKLELSMTYYDAGVQFNRPLKKLDFAEMALVRIMLTFEAMVLTDCKNVDTYKIIEDKPITTV
jgi:hypothetical protein